MNNTIQPLRIAQTCVKNTANTQQRKLNFTNKFDNVELSTKPKMSKGKKALIITGATIGALAVTAGVITLVHKGYIKSIQKEGASIQEKAQKVVDEFMEKFKNVQPLEDGTKVIEEFAQDGKTLARKATLDVDDFLTINDYANKTRIEATKGDLDLFYKKVEFFEDNSYKCKELFFFNNRELNGWYKNLQRNADDSGSYKKGVIFNDGKLQGMIKNLQENADDSFSYKKGVIFEDGKLSSLIKNQQQNADGSWSEARGINFKDGKLYRLTKNYKKNADGTWTADKDVRFKNGKLWHILKNYQKNADGTWSADKDKYFGKNK